MATSTRALSTTKPTIGAHLRGWRQRRRLSQLDLACEANPEGLAPRIANLAQWRAHLLARLRQQIDLTAGPVLVDLMADHLLAT
jgi:hypothetical protein